MDVTSPAGSGIFFGIRRRCPPKVKVVYRTIISDDSTFGLVIMSRNAHRSALTKIGSREEQAMNLGFFTMPIHPLDKDWRQSLREDREAFLLADELGFTEAYVGEHTTDRAENITSCIAFLAWIAAATKQIRLGHGGDARSHARRAFDLRNKPGRAAFGC